MSSKHVFSSPQGLVLKSLRGAVAMNPGLRLHAPSKSVYVARPSAHARVALVAGGGAGHEPAHASYTGRGMLAASVSGDIFASPSARQIQTAIELALLAAQQVQGNDSREFNPNDLKEVLLVINNYTGDRLNFGLALTRARALYPTLSIDTIVVADDVSLLRAPTPSLVGPRGLAGNILVCKILGAYAESGAPLVKVKTLGDAVVRSLASVGVGLEHCHVPGRKIDSSGSDNGADKDSADKVCEIGMGLHNEPGVRKGTFNSAEGLVGEMLEMILSSGSRSPAGEETFLHVGKFPTEMDEVVLFVNNLGGMSQLEMGALLDEALLQLRAINVHPRRVYSSSYMTSLNAPGFSLSLLNLSSIRRSLSTPAERSGTEGLDEDVDLLALLDAPTDAAAWIGVRSGWPEATRDGEKEEAETERMLRALRPKVDQAVGETPAAIQGKEKVSYWREADISVAMVEAGIRTACTRVLELEGALTAFDTVVGDGDCGETFAAGAKAVLRALDDGDINVNALDPPGLMQKLGEILEDSMGGTIGGLLAIFFTSMSTVVPVDASGTWHDAPARALTALSAHTPARPGDRTIVDALSPFCKCLSTEAPGRRDFSSVMTEAVQQAREGAESTKGMKARLGRAVYVGGADEGGNVEDSLPPDPGAWGVAAVLEGLWTGMKGM